MKFIHLSDLHLGKRVNEFSMLQDQGHILGEILSIVEVECPDAVLIAGDIYDKSVPSIEAVSLLDSFLYSLSILGTKVFIISGNHDSPERLAFGSRLMNSSGVYMSLVYMGSVEKFSLSDDYGIVNIFMLPFIKPAHVRRFFPDAPIESYTDAVRAALSNIEIDLNARNIIMAHQFVTGAERSESEEISVGGSDNVDSSVFDAFDYVALGHIHRSQRAGHQIARYCGTPLKYSFSEANHEKSVTVVDLGSKGDILVRTVKLTPLRDLREIRGSYMELSAKDSYVGSNTEDYIHITLTDEEDIPDAIGKLRTIYPNIMRLDYDNSRTRANMEISAAEAVELKTPLELFTELYEKQNNNIMSDEQIKLALELIDDIWGAEQ